MWEILYTSLSKLSKKLKNGIGILAGQAVFKLWIKTVKILDRLSKNREEEEEEENEQH